MIAGPDMSLYTWVNEEILKNALNPSNIIKLTQFNLENGH